MATTRSNFNSKQSLPNSIPVDSKFGFFEVFNDKSITKGFHSLNHHNLSKKYQAKIPLAVTDTIVVDNGQLVFWAFTDNAGFVMKKSMKKLNKDYILPYLLNYVLDYLRATENFMVKKTESQILWDVNRYSTIMQDRKADSNRFYQENEYDYLERFTVFRFILVHYSSSEKKFINIFEFADIFNDTSLLTGINMIQFYFNANFKFKPLICKYTRKSLLEAKKYQLFTEKPISSISSTSTNNNFNTTSENTNGFIHTRSSIRSNQGHRATLKDANLLPSSNSGMSSNVLSPLRLSPHKRKRTASIDSEEEVKSNENQMIILNDSNLCGMIETMLEPFIKLIEKSKSVIITEAYFKLVKIKEYICVQDKQIMESTQNSFKYANTVNAQLSNAFNITNSNFIPQQNKKMNEYFVFAYANKVTGISKKDEEFISQQNDIKSRMNKIKEKKIPKELLFGVKETESNQNRILTSAEKISKNRSTSTNFKTYEKVTKDAFCYGEFCPYQVPKFFKNLKKTREDEINVTNVPKENKFTERDRFHNLPNSLPLFLIKKAYDNPSLVNIVLKAYSIFPPDFDKDSALREINRIRREEEERRREEEKMRENSSKKNPETKSLPMNSLFPDLNMNSYTSEKEENEKVNKNVITLYTPKPGKFDHVNHDAMYSKKSVCNSCYIIYSLIHNFLNNIDETTAQFKSLSKARDLLIQGDKLANPLDANDDSHNEEQEDNLLFQEERNQFDLKSILKKNIKKIKKEAMKNLVKRRDKTKVNRNTNYKKEEIEKAFSYNLNINPTLLKLSLLAEKTKNKFFNLIFNEMKTEPESIFQRLGIKQPESQFSKSMTTLRMHMGLNSSSYNVNMKELGKLNKRINDEVVRDYFQKHEEYERVKEKDKISGYSAAGVLKPLNSRKNFNSNNLQEIHEGQNGQYQNNPPLSNKVSGDIQVKTFKSSMKKNFDEFRDILHQKNSSSSMRKFNERDSFYNFHQEASQVDVDLFLAYKNLKKSYSSSPFGTVFSKKAKKKNSLLMTLNTMNVSHTEPNKQIDHDQDEDDGDINDINTINNLVTIPNHLDSENSNIPQINLVTHEVDENQENNENFEFQEKSNEKSFASEMEENGNNSGDDASIKDRNNHSSSSKNSGFNSNDSSYLSSEISKSMVKNQAKKTLSHISESKISHTQSDDGETHENENAKNKFSSRKNGTTEKNNSNRKNYHETYNPAEKKSYTTKSIIRAKTINNFGNEKMAFNSNKNLNNIKNNLNQNPNLNSDISLKSNNFQVIDHIEIENINKNSIQRKSISYHQVKELNINRRNSVEDSNKKDKFDNNEKNTKSDKKPKFDKLKIKNNNDNFIKPSNVQEDHNENDGNYNSSLKSTGKNSLIKSSNNSYESSKKITVSSIFYYDWGRDGKYDSNNHYFYVSTPMTKFNEMNNPVIENPLLFSQNITAEEFMKIGKFDYSMMLKNSEIFVYDQYTAVPYRVTVLKDENDSSSNFMSLNFTGQKKESSVGKSNKSIQPQIKRPTNRRSSTAMLKESKGAKCLVIHLNDFYDSYCKYESEMTELWSTYAESLSVLKLVFLNFPGQSCTLFSKKSIINNMYNAEFLDRFLNYLMRKEYFDHTYYVIFVGFGNGGQTALTYTACYEKYWDFLHSVILFNSFCENDEFINKSMLEILKNIEGSKSVKLVDFFVKSITVNPKILLDLDRPKSKGKTHNNNMVSYNTFNAYNFKYNHNGKLTSHSNEPNQISMTGYHSITKGYFYNVKINHGDIQTPIVAVHSNQNCFITINNINLLFGHVKNKTFSVTEPKKKINRNVHLESPLNVQVSAPHEYTYEELLPHSKVKRKMIVIDGSHDILYDKSDYVDDIMHSYMRYMLNHMAFGAK
jgi:hypothetical protein